MLREEWTRGPFDPAESAADCAPGTATAAGSPFGPGLALCERATTYDGLDRVVGRTDAAGGRTDVEYDAAGRVRAVVVHRTATLRLRTERAYDRDGNPLRRCTPRHFAGGTTELAEVPDPAVTACTPDARFAVHVGYDPGGRVDSVTRYRHQPGAGTGRDAATGAIVEHRRYDAEGNVVAVTRPNGARDEDAHTVRFGYDAVGRRVSASVPGAPVTPATPDGRYPTTYGYDPAGNLRSVTRSGDEPLVTAYTYDAAHRLVDVVEGADLDPVTREPTGLATGARNARTRRLHDRDGNVVAVFEPRAFVSSLDPDPAYLTRIEFDEDGRAVRRYVPRTADAGTAGLTATQSTDCSTSKRPAAVPVSAAMPAVPAYPPKTGVCLTTMRYDAAGNVVEARPGSSTGTDGRTVGFGYSDDGLPIRVVRPAVAPGGPVGVTRLAYDGAGRRRKAAESVPGRVTRWTYDLDGSLTEVERPPAGTAAHVTRNEYNLDGAIARVTMPGDERSTFRHYADGSVAENEDGAGNVTRYHYDRNGNPVRVYSPAAVWSVDHPGAPDPANESGSPALNFFDAAGLLVTTAVPVTGDGAEYRRTDFGYDGAGRQRTTATGLVIDSDRASGTRSISYHPNDRIATRTGRGQGAGTVSYAYDAAGHVVGVTDSSGSAPAIAAEYYLDGRLSRVTDGTAQTGGRETRYEYTGSGLVSARRRPSPCRTAPGSTGRTTRTTRCSTRRTPVATVPSSRPGRTTTTLRSGCAARA